MRSTIPMLIDSLPATPRTFRAKRTLKQAFKLVEQVGEVAAPKLRKASFGNDPRDTRFIVNYLGSNPRPRVQVARAREIMRNGIRCLYND